MNIFRTHDLHKHYIVESGDSLKGKQVYALNNIDLTIKDKESICIMGDSGSGKTTLLKIMGGMLLPSKGYLYYKDSNLYELSNSDLEKYRRTQIGFVFQDYKLLNNLTIEDNIMLPMMLDHQNIDDSIDKMMEMVRLLKIKDKLTNYPYELSGGQQQRVAICRALMNNPNVILADEPTGNLDLSAANVVMDLLLDIKNKFNKTLIIVTHNEKIAKQCDRIIEIREGKIV